MTDWNDANIEILKAGVANGESYTQIAKRIPGCTRNGAIGKAGRMGIAGHKVASKPGRVPRAPIVARAPKQNAHLSLRPRPVIVAGNSSVFEAGEARPPRVDLSLEAFEPLPGSSPIPWLERRSGMCCWPVGGEGADMLVCGLEVHDRGWCWHHFKRGTQTAAVTRRVDERIGIVPKRRAYG